MHFDTSRSLVPDLVHTYNKALLKHELDRLKCTPLLDSVNLQVHFE